MARLSTKKTGVPRAYRDHRTVQARAYAAYVRALTASLGPLPPHAMPWLKEAGRLSVELERLGADLDAARSRANGLKQAGAIRRQAYNVRAQLLEIETRLAEIAKPKQRTIAEVFFSGDQKTNSTK